MNHFGIDEEDHMLVLEAFRGGPGVESKKSRMATLAQSASIPELVVANVFNMLEKEGDTDKLFSAFRPMIKRNNKLQLLCRSLSGALIETDMKLFFEIIQSEIIIF